MKTAALRRWCRETKAHLLATVVVPQLSPKICTGCADLFTLQLVHASTPRPWLRLRRGGFTHGCYCTDTARHFGFRSSDLDPPPLLPRLPRCLCLFSPRCRQMVLWLLPVANLLPAYSWAPASFPRRRPCATRWTPAARDMVTVALRRADLSGKQGPVRQHPRIHRSGANTSCSPTPAARMNAEEAVRLARLAAAAGLPKWVKLEIHPDPRYLLPDPVETLKAAEMLVKEGFTVLPYINADPVLAKRLAGRRHRHGDAARLAHRLEPRHQTRDQIRIIIEQATVPVVVDAGIWARPATPPKPWKWAPTPCWSTPPSRWPVIRSAWRSRSKWPSRPAAWLMKLVWPQNTELPTPPAH